LFNKSTAFGVVFIVQSPLIGDFPHYRLVPETPVKASSPERVPERDSTNTELDSHN
jgi:cytochrome bd-type quinol oxidase subunit 1